jgi:hypothetical protein
MVSLGVRRSEFRKPVGEGFAYPARLSPMLIQPSAEGVPGLFPGSKAAGECVVHPPPSSAEFKERIKLCTSSTPSLDHHGLLQGAINLYLTFIWLVYWISIIHRISFLLFPCVWSTYFRMVPKIPWYLLRLMWTPHLEQHDTFLHQVSEDVNLYNDFIIDHPFTSNMILTSEYHGFRFTV